MPLPKIQSKLVANLPTGNIPPELEDTINETAQTVTQQQQAIGQLQQSVISAGNNNIATWNGVTYIGVALPRVEGVYYTFIGPVSPESVGIKMLDYDRRVLTLPEPTALPVVTKTDTSFLAEWDPAPSTTYTQYYLTVRDEATGLVLPAYNGKTITHPTTQDSVTGLQANKKYLWSVSGYDGTKYSKQSNTIEVTTEAAAAVSTITNEILEESPDVFYDFEASFNDSSSNNRHAAGARVGTTVALPSFGIDGFYGNTADKCAQTTSVSTSEGSYIGVDLASNYVISNVGFCGFMRVKASSQGRQYGRALALGRTTNTDYFYIGTGNTSGQTNKLRMQLSGVFTLDIDREVFNGLARTIIWRIIGTAIEVVVLDENKTQMGATIAATGSSWTSRTFDRITVGCNRAFNVQYNVDAFMPANSQYDKVWMKASNISLARLIEIAQASENS